VVCIADLFAFVDLHASRWRLRSPWQRTLSMIVQYYDRQGFPIPAESDESSSEPGWMLPMLQWAQMMEDPDYKRVAYDELPDGSYLSTVWLGLDHAHGLGPPLIFETMRFPNDGTFAQMEFPDIFGESDETVECLRYGSEEEALAAHHEIVRRLRIREGH